jgi:Lon protease-like protein
MSDNPFDSKFEDLPAELPLFPLNGVLLLPRGRLPLNVFEPRYLNMVEHALGHQRLIGIVQPMVDGQAGLSAPDGTALYHVGCAGRITSFQETTGGQIQLILRGVCRFDIIDELPLMNDFRRARSDFTPYKNDFSSEDGTTIDRQRLLSDLRAYFDMENIEVDWEMIKQTPDDRLVTTLAMVCPFEPNEKQALLESADLAHRCKLIIGLIESALRRDDDNGGTAAMN